MRQVLPSTVSFRWFTMLLINYKRQFSSRPCHHTFVSLISLSCISWAVHYNIWLYLIPKVEKLGAKFFIKQFIKDIPICKKCSQSLNVLQYYQMAWVLLLTVLHQIKIIETNDKEKYVYFEWSRVVMAIILN